MFFTPGSSCTPRCAACATILLVTLTLTLATPSTERAAAISALRRPSIWLAAG